MVTRMGRCEGMISFEDATMGLIRCVSMVVVMVLCGRAWAVGPDAGKAFSMNGWQFHEYNVPKLEEAVEKAPGYGVNFFIFSHGWFRSVEGFLASTDEL